MDSIPTGIVYPDRDRRFCPDARIELPGYCPEIGPNAQKMSSSKKRSHRNSGQNGPVERSTALTGTIFVNISVFVSRGNFQGAFRAGWAGCPFARIGRKSLCRDTFFCPDARIHLPGYCRDTIHQSVTTSFASKS